MLTFWGVVTALSLYGGLPAVGGLWLFQRWRSRRRNRNGECAACGTSWAATPSAAPFLIQGRLVCEACGERARRRMRWHFGFLALGAVLGSTGLAVAGADIAIMILLPAASVVVIAGGAVQLMKLANRNAQRRIATGEYPELEALKSES